MHVTLHNLELATADYRLLSFAQQMAKGAQSETARNLFAAYVKKELARIEAYGGGLQAESPQPAATQPASGAVRP